MSASPLLSSIAVFLLALAGGMLGSARRISEERLHLALAFAAGFFLGAAFLELLPAAFSTGGGLEPVTIGGLALLGFLVIYVVERGLAPASSGQSHSEAHATIAMTALLGLSVHSIAEGGALLIASESDAGGSIVLSIALHKGIAGLALGSLFGLAHFTKYKTIVLLVAFALMTPAGAGLSALALTDEGVVSSAAFTAITALSSGVFLYVATVDILPEVLHSKAPLVWKLLLVVAGAFVMWVITLFEGG
jgi:zinc and cadmium transporter